MLGLCALTILSAMPALAGPQEKGLGAWFDDDCGMPAYHYTGPLNFPESPMGYGFEREPQKYLGDDPYFLLGNPRLKMFSHASGHYQLLTGERAWGRLNQGEQRWSGDNQATATIDGKRHELIGMNAQAALGAEKRFGVGFARYDYRLGETKITRLLSVAPSRQVRDGSSAFLVQVQLRNEGRKPVKISFAETARANYMQALAFWDSGATEVRWTNDEPRQTGDTFVSASFTAHGRRLMTFPAQGAMSRLEGNPPTLFLKAFDGAQAFFEKGAQTHLGAKFECDLPAGEQRNFAFIVGYTRELSSSQLEPMIGRVAEGAKRPIRTASAFADEWQTKLPTLNHETDAGLRREMRWDAAVLEQLATWREYYDETVIPQGTMYDFAWGLMASNRDLAQQALPLCHTNPELAKSTLRFILKRCLPDGDIKLNDEGYGWSAHSSMSTSDQQLHFFLLLSEYLRKTKDTSILDESIGYYPAENGGSGTGWAHVRQAFLFLRDRISTGPHQLVRLWNSDWNDMFYAVPTKHPYNDMFTSSESLMNTAMAVVLLKELPDRLESTGRSEAKELAAAMREYRAELLQAWNHDLGERSFPRRAWLNGQESCGEKDMWLEPQGYALQIPEMSLDRKRKVISEVENRLMAGEALGARQMEKPAINEGMQIVQPGTRENGGFWYSLNGPLILGVASIDRARAWTMLRNMTFSNFSEHFPNYWPGRWTHADAVDASVSKHNGMAPIPVFCAHPHAWPLYCYLRLKENQ